MNQLPADSEILALVPEYTDCGNSVRLYLADGREILIAGTLRAVLRALARRRCKDLGLLRAYAARYTQRRFANPLAVSPDLVLAPLRTRAPKIPGDPTQGLVNVAAPIRLTAESLISAPAKPGGTDRRHAAAPNDAGAAPAGKSPDGAPAAKAPGRVLPGKSPGDVPEAGPSSAVRPAIELPGGRRIPLGWSAATVRRHLADARSLYADLVREQQESLLRRLVAASSAGDAASLP